MIYLTPQTVLQHIAEVMEGVMLPDLNSNYAKGQAHAAVAMLRNVAMLWPDFNAIYREDNKGLTRLLVRFLKLETPTGDAAEDARRFQNRVVAALDEIDPKAGDYVPLRAANVRLRTLTDQMLVDLDSRGEDRKARSLRKAVRAHLKSSLSRELAGESQSALLRMSRGD
jgi:hypothetical protein